MTRLPLHRPELIILTNYCVIGISGLIVQLSWDCSFRANQRRVFPAATDWHGNSLERLHTSARQPLYLRLGYSAWHPVSSAADSPLTGRQVSWLAGGVFFSPHATASKRLTAEKSPIARNWAAQHVPTMRGSREQGTSLAPLKRTTLQNPKRHIVQWVDPHLPMTG